MSQFIAFFLHVDRYLSLFIQTYGVWTYGVLFLVIFCETGLVVAPFLPGDSLLFTAGTFAATGSFDIVWLVACFSVAAFLGDSVNYLIGRLFGERLLAHPRFSRWIRPEYMERTRHFYEKHGSKMIVFARFVPFVRTFAPFVAGIGRMHYRTFLMYNILGGLVWVFLFTLGGYFFGNIPVVQENLTLVIFLIIAVSLVPPCVEYLRQRRRVKRTVS